MRKWKHKDEDKVFLLAGNATGNDIAVREEEIQYYISTHTIDYIDVCLASDFHVRQMLTKSVQHFADKHHDHHGDLMIVGGVIGGIFILLFTLLYKGLFSLRD